MRTSRLRILWLAGAVGCLPADGTTVCADGLVCPADLVCAPLGGGCVNEDQVTACQDVATGGACELPQFGAGVCLDGICQITGCGDGTTTAGETCDDGNQVSGDGCRADCAKVEVCGDAVVDAAEPCDDGNGNVADGCDACVATTWDATALLGAGQAASASSVDAPRDLVVDRAGNVFFSEPALRRVRRIDGATGILTTVAGARNANVLGDGGPAASASLAYPRGLAVDGLGNLFIADTFARRVRRVDADTGVITTVAGTGDAGDSGDGGPATSARLVVPIAVAVDGLGSLYVLDAQAARVRRVDADTGVITTIAGTGATGFAGDGGPASAAQFAEPQSLAIDGDGDLLIADTDNHRIRRIDGVTRVITTIAGTGVADFSGDGGPAAAATLRSPGGVAVDAVGDVYVADAWNFRVRRIVAATQQIVSFAGGASGCDLDAPVAAAAACLDVPQGVATSTQGDVFIADTGHQRLRRVAAATDLLTTLAGTGAVGELGDGAAATSVAIRGVEGVATDGAGNVYFVQEAAHVVARVDAAGVLTIVAGTGVPGFSGDGAAALAAELHNPSDVVIDAQGALLIADRFNHRIRRVDLASGIISTFAGTGGPGFSGDGGAATSAALNEPRGLAVDAEGSVIVVDTANRRVRRITAGQISTIAGDGNLGDSGDDGAALAARFLTPLAAAVAPDGDVLVADVGAHRIRRIDAATNQITTTAGTGAAAFSGDGGPAALAQLSGPRGVAVDAEGNLFIADGDNRRVRRVDRVTQVITTVAGTSTPSAGDGGPAVANELGPTGAVAVDATGDVYFTEVDARVRRLTADGTVFTIAGSVDPPGMGPVAQARLASPESIAVAPDFTLFAGGTTGTVQALRPSVGQLQAIIGRYPSGFSTGNLARYRDFAFPAVHSATFDAAAGHVYVAFADQLARVEVIDVDDPRTWTLTPLSVAHGSPGFRDGAVDQAKYRSPAGLFFDDVERVLYVADRGNHVIRAIDVDAGQVSTIAGTPATRGYFGEGIAALEALLFAPGAVTRCAATGDLFVADTGNHRVRRIAAGSGIITTVLGDGVPASSGEGPPATAFPVEAPRGIACDAAGNVYVTSTSTVRLLPAAIASGQATGLVDGTGPVQTIYGAPPRDAFPASVTTCLTGLAVVDPARVQVVDACAGLLVELVRRAAP